MFIVKLSDRTTMELTDTYRPYQQQLQRTLSLLDGDDHFSLLLFYVPDDAGWPDGPGFDVAEYEAEYLQSAGRVDSMVLEFRRNEGDGRYHQYAVGRPGTPDRSTVTVGWRENSTTVPDNEIFDAAEAATIFDFYRRNRTIPDGYSLRELDLN